MDLALIYKIAVIISSLIIGHSNATRWDKYFGQNLMLRGTSQEGKQDVRIISKRSADWSNRRSGTLASSVEYKLDAQESDNVDVTTKLPKIVRKIRFQNVPQQARHFENNGNNVEKVGNDTITSDKQGRVVRVRKFRKKMTTVKPITTTTTSTTTTAMPVKFRSIAPQMVQHYRNPNSITTSTENPIPFRSFTPQMTQYAHITVINKEVIDQKPNRKQKNKKQTRLHALSDTIDENRPYGNEKDSKEQSMDGTFNSVPNKSRGYRSSEANKRSDSDEMPTDDLIEKSSSREEVTSKLSTKRRDTKVLPKETLPQEETEKIKPRNYQFNKRNPVRDVKRLKSHQPGNISQTTEITSTTPVAKSVEVLSDSSPTENNGTLQSNPEPKQRDGYTEEIDATTQAPLYTDIMLVTIPPEAEHQLGPMIPNTGFRHFPQHEFQGHPYGPTNPFFRTPGGQTPFGIQQTLNGGPLSFRQPFNRFYHQNEPQFQGYYPPPHQIPPYSGAGSLGTPGFYHSPQLETLRRSIIDSYAEEESAIESTTEYSLPKFEIPSIDFNDKGCRTVYKEVSAVPADTSNPKSVENKAKSFVMTRECFFPEGVPTTRYVDTKELIGDTTPATRDI